MNSQHWPAVLLLAWATALVPGAEVAQVTFKSPALGIDKKLTVILPRAYATDAAARFPVVYWLDGYAGSDERWAKQTSLPDLVDRDGIIAVCPDGTVDSWYIDSTIHPEHRYETFIWQDVPTWVDAHYRTRATAAGRGITGLSMGGHGAMFAGLRHPEVFGAVASMSGGLDIRPFADNWGIKNWLGEIKDHKQDWDEHTVITQLDHVKPGQAILFDCGTEDFFLAVNRFTHAKLDALKIPHTYQEFPGGHSWDYWKLAVVRHMAFFAAAFNGAKAVTAP
ncbi:MAG: esterase family protein [Planctomycetes bacterium]|nr:esterase family protein [Planctomycetota bacterium]